MPLNLDTLPSPLFDEPVRSAIQMVKRMMLLRWSAGSFLTGIGGNYGVDRPPLGFSNDDIFRSCLQVLMADYKTIPNAFWQLLEIILGAYEDIYYEVAQDYDPQDEVLHIRKYGDYLSYDPTSKVGFPPGFSTGERLRSTHPVTGEIVDGIYLFDDSANNRLYLEVVASTDPNFTFSPGIEIEGVTSGAKLTPNGEVTVIDLIRIPIYTEATVYRPAAFPANPLDVSLSAHKEDAVLCTPSRYLERIRVVNPMSTSFQEGDLVYIPGGCWDFIQTEARRVKVRLLCEDKNRNGLPGNAYVHKNPFQESKLRERASAGDTSLQIEDLQIEDIASLIPPNLHIVIDPEGEHLRVGGGTFLVEATSYNPTTGTFTLSAPLPAERFWPRGAVLRWVQAETGEVLVGSPIGQDYLDARCRVSNPYGPWIIDEGGANEEIVFVKGTTYQKRNLVGNLRVGDNSLWLDQSFSPEASQNQRCILSDSNTGLIGDVIVDVDQGREIDLLVPSAIATDIDNYETVLELCEASNFQVRLSLASPMSKTHLATETMRRFYGVTTSPAPPPVWGSRLPSAGWPPAVSPTGQWPGPNVFEPSEFGAINQQGSGLVHLRLDRSGVTNPALFYDPRIYLAVTELTADFDPSAAITISLLGFGPISSQDAPIYIIEVEDGSLFPSLADIGNWWNSPNNPDSPYPLKVIVGSEGGFGRRSLYYWGKEPPVAGKHTRLYVSGLQRIHLAGTKVSVYVEDLPVELITGTWGGDPGLKSEDGKVILDFGSSRSEVVDYAEAVPLTLTRGFLRFERGYVPVHSHDPNKVSSLDGSVIGVDLVRSDKTTIPRKDGYSFPFYLGGNAALMRLRYLLDQVRAAGVTVEFYDANDSLLVL